MLRVLRRAVDLGGGLLAWSITEYVFHRVAMHNIDKIGPVAAEHDRHHRDPYATSPLARTALYGAVLGPVTLVGRGLVRRSSLGGTTALAGWAFGFVGYEQFHWLAHHRAPRTAWGRSLRRRHFAHHFGRPRANFGVTTGLWDRVFRTEIPANGAVRVPARMAMPWAIDATGRVRSEYLDEYVLAKPARRPS